MDASPCGIRLDDAREIERRIVDTVNNFIPGGGMEWRPSVDWQVESYSTKRAEDVKGSLLRINSTQI